MTALSPALMVMAEEVGFEVCPPRVVVMDHNVERRLARFAALVAAAERDACAQVCDEQTQRWVDDRARYCASECAAAIRARGQA